MRRGASRVRRVGRIYSSNSSLLRSFFVNFLLPPVRANSSRARRSSLLASCRVVGGGVGWGAVSGLRVGKKKVIFSVRDATIGGTGGSGKRRVAHLGRLARRLLLLFLPLLGRQDLDLGRRPLLALLRLSPVEDTVAELDAVLRGKTLGGFAVRQLFGNDGLPWDGRNAGRSARCDGRDRVEPALTDRVGRG